MLQKIITNGKNDVDRAALVVGQALGLETDSARAPTDYKGPYYASSRKNLSEADGVLLLGLNPPRVWRVKSLYLPGYYAWIRNEAQATNKPLMVINLGIGIDTAIFNRWLADHQIATLYVTGPQQPGVFEATENYLTTLLGGR